MCEIRIFLLIEFDLLEITLDMIPSARICAKVMVKNLIIDNIMLR